MKTFIKNRKDQNVSVVVNEGKEGLVFIMNGLGGNKDHDHIVAVSEVFEDKGFTTVRFDPTNTFGESDGKYEDATTTNYFEDLEDVIEWAKDQGWYQEPFYLVGHSLGGICVAMYANKHPKKVKQLILASPTISAELLESKRKHLLKEINGVVWYFGKSHTNGVKQQLKWTPFIEDLRKYKLINFISPLRIPILILVGEEENYKEPLTKISQDLNLKLEVIKGAPHCYRQPEHLQQLKEIIEQWLKQ
jgi:alpha/beta superfamily hydrolase